MQTKDHAKFATDSSGALVRQDIQGDNYSVVRIKRDFLANSDIGAILTSRQSSKGHDYNRSEGLDANLRFHDAHTITAFIADTQTDGLDGPALAQKYAYTYHTSLWKVLTIWTDLKEDFNPEVGFTQRTGTRFCPTPSALASRGVSPGAAPAPSRRSCAPTS